MVHGRILIKQQLCAKGQPQHYFQMRGESVTKILAYFLTIASNLNSKWLKREHLHTLYTMPDEIARFDTRESRTVPKFGLNKYQSYIFAYISIYYDHV